MFANIMIETEMSTNRLPIGLATTEEAIGISINIVVLKLAARFSDSRDKVSAYISSAKSITVGRKEMASR
ncbi:hypothetical protein GCM10009038_16530 [Salinicola rhizosphaerae]|uniref:Uncharacterized protein n=1 Tax=Salinicola rhizosphaerae TaxID=1443141 RepID=A0ABQ3E1R1_9GAMM|nr:hypothetical protein GCM10009038_16530 [Salinicola rhizosphaerae]